MGPCDGIVTETSARLLITGDMPLPSLPVEKKLYVLVYEDSRAIFFKIILLDCGIALKEVSLIPGSEA